MKQIFKFNNKITDYRLMPLGFKLWPANFDDTNTAKPNGTARSFRVMPSKMYS